MKGRLSTPLARRRRERALNGNDANCESGQWI
jgi:hypothetical protein